MSRNDKRPKDFSASRRDFLMQFAGATVVAACGNAFSADSSDGTAALVHPSLDLGDFERKSYENWSREMLIEDVLTYAPKTPADVVAVANWARANGYRVRPVGSTHGFAPTILSRYSTGTGYILLRTMEHLHAIQVNADGPIKSVTAQVGAALDRVAAEAHTYGLGFYHTPAPGGISVGGSLAMNTHGNGLPPLGEKLEPGHSYGTMSNLVLQLTAVVWDDGQDAYVLRTFQRADPEIGPLLTSVARSFVTEVTLQLGPSLMLRNTNRVDLSAATLFAEPAAAGSGSFMSLVDNVGPTELIWFPYVEESVWVRQWSVAPVKPTTAREVDRPYNYPFSYGMELEVSNTLSDAFRSLPASIPAFNTLIVQSFQDAFTPDDAAAQMVDMWGPAYCTTFTVLPDTLRITVGAWGILMNRKNMQRAVSEFHRFFRKLLDEYAAKLQYPYSGPVEIRGHGLDRTSDLLIPGAVEPYLSGARPCPDHPDYDMVLWYAVNTVTDLPFASEFFTKVERFMIDNHAPYGVCRPEWTKAYGYTLEGAWKNRDLLVSDFPQTWRTGYSADTNWDAAVSKLNSYDPHRIFANEFLDTLMPG